MADVSPNLHLTYLAQGQAQKHVSVNESLQRLDALVQLSVVSAVTSAEPVSPVDGCVYVLPAGKTGAHWGAMADHALAYYRDGFWEEIAPRAGWLACALDTGDLLRFGGASWARFPAARLIEMSATDRVLGRFAPGAGAAEEIAFTEPARALCDDGSFQAMCATLGTWRVLAASAVPVSHTGNTSETTLATITIPAGAMGPNGVVRVDMAFSFTNSVSNKTAILRFGGAGGATYLGTPMTSHGHARFQRLIANRNAVNSQMGASHNNAGGFGLAGGGPVSTSAVNTAANVDLVIRGQLANASDTMALESYLVEVFYGA